MTGLYEIKCLKTGNRIVSGSTQVKGAVKNQMDMLFFGVHPNHLLTLDYEENADEFTTTLIKQCTSKHLIKAEVDYLALHKDDETLLNDRDANNVPIGDASKNAKAINMKLQNRVKAGKKAYLKMVQDIKNEIKGEQDHE